jgi:A1 cistron-splicing factor AAR2
MDCSPGAGHLAPSESGIVLCLGCPEGVLFGIDYNAWTVGPKFMGVKLIPPGLHYIYCSPGADDVGVSRSGFFAHIKPRTVVVRRWDQESEELVVLDSDDEVMRFTDGALGFDFDGNLGPYPIEKVSQWNELTRHCHERLVQRVEPVGGVLRSKRQEYNESQSNGVPEPLEPFEAARCGLFFTQLPRARVPKGATPEEVTRLHHDRSSQLDDLIEEFKHVELDLLGELQMAFVAFLLGQNFDAYEQWRGLLSLLSSCEEAVGKRPELFAELLRVLFAQIQQSPDDLFEDDMLKGNFLGKCAVDLVEVCSGDSAPPKLQQRSGKLRELLRRRFGVGPEDAALLGEAVLGDEDAPVIVEIPEELQEELLMTNKGDTVQMMELD